MSSVTFDAHTKAEDVADLYKDRIKGRNALITGVSLGGLGFETARVFAKHGALVIATGRNLDKVEEAFKEIRKETPKANLRALQLDLTSFANIRKAAKEVLSYPEPIHYLFANAGIANHPFSLSKDGFESHLATNHLGHALFIQLVLPKVKQAHTATFTPRIIIVSSAVHELTPFRFDNYNFKTEGSYDPMTAYSQSKTANILYASELARVLTPKVEVFSLHPGLVKTSMNLREEAESMRKGFDVLNDDGTWKTTFQWGEQTLVIKEVENGAATQVWAALEPSLAGHSGEYVSDCKLAPEALAEHVKSPENDKRLYDLTHKLVGLD